MAAATALPDVTILRTKYPNPFNPSTTIPYAVTEAGIVRLTVHNTLGQQVRVLVDQHQAPGSYQVSWDGGDGAGVQVAAGVYPVRLAAGSQVQVHKMLLTK